MRLSKRAKRTAVGWLLTLVIVAGVATTLRLFGPPSLPGTTPPSTQQSPNSVLSSPGPSIDYGKTTDNLPTASLATSVLTPAVISQFKGVSLVYDGQGSFYINSNKSTLTPPSEATTPFVRGGNLNNQGQLSASSAVLTSNL